jgi:hypothetical protein
LRCNETIFIEFRGNEDNKEKRVEILYANENKKEFSWINHHLWMVILLRSFSFNIIHELDQIGSRVWIDSNV